MTLNKKSQKKTSTRRRPKGRSVQSRPAKAYAGERTDMQRYQSVFRITGGTSGGIVEPVNLSISDQLTVLQSTWALWRLEKFTVRATPAANVQGAYAICPFEATLTPVTPTNLAAVLDGGGKLKSISNQAENRSTVSYKKKTVNEALYTSTSLTTATGGDPGFSLFQEVFGAAELGAIFYVEVDAWFSFREPTQFATRARIFERLITPQTSFYTKPNTPLVIPDSQVEEKQKHSTNDEWQVIDRVAQLRAELSKLTVATS